MSFQELQFPHLLGLWFCLVVLLLGRNCCVSLLLCWKAPVPCTCVCSWASLARGWQSLADVGKLFLRKSGWESSAAGKGCSGGRCRGGSCRFQSRREQCPSWTVQYWTVTQNSCISPTAQRLGWVRGRSGLNLSLPDLRFPQGNKGGRFPRSHPCLPSFVSFQLCPVQGMLGTACPRCQWGCPRWGLCQVEENVQAGALQSQHFFPTGAWHLILMEWAPKAPAPGRGLLCRAREHPQGRSLKQFDVFILRLGSVLAHPCRRCSSRDVWRILEKGWGKNTLGWQVPPTRGRICRGRVSTQYLNPEE